VYPLYRIRLIFPCRELFYGMNAGEQRPGRYLGIHANQRRCKMMRVNLGMKSACRYLPAMSALPASCVTACSVRRNYAADTSGLVSISPPPQNQTACGALGKMTRVVTRVQFKRFKEVLPAATEEVVRVLSSRTCFATTCT
jgi:hypothetical protein